MTQETDNPTQLLTSIRDRRERAKAEPSRLDPKASAMRTRIPYAPAPQGEKFKTVRLNATVSEVELEALAHLARATNSTRRALIEQAIRNLASELDPPLIEEIKQALRNR